MRTLHGLATRELPNLFFVQNAQSGASINFLYTTDNQVKHAAWIIAKARDHGWVAVEPSERGETEWVDTITKLSQMRVQWLQECTPSRFNAEGLGISEKGRAYSAYGKGGFRADRGRGVAFLFDPYVAPNPQESTPLSNASKIGARTGRCKALSCGTRTDARPKGCRRRPSFEREEKTKELSREGLLLPLAFQVGCLKLKTLEYIKRVQSMVILFQCPVCKLDDRDRTVACGRPPRGLAKWNNNPPRILF